MYVSEWSNEIVDLCLEFRNYGVVGMDVAGDESIGPFDPVTVEAFSVRSYNFNLLK